MKKVVSIIITFLTIILLILIQSNILNNLPLYGIIPNVGIAFVAITGILAGEKVGILVGATYGLLADCYFERTLGIYLGLFMLLGYISGKIQNKIAKDNRLGYVILISASTIIFELVRFNIGLMFLNYEFELLYLIKVILLEIIYNIFLTIIFYRPFAFWGEILNRSRKGYYEY